MIVVVAAVCLVYGISAYSNTYDTEILNGEVTNKRMERVSCRHPYCCKYCESCSTDSKGNRSCTTYCCRTCYDHPYDQDWNVFTNLGTYTIATLDRQGLKEPPRWTKAEKGQPVAQKHLFINYIKGVPQSLFNENAVDANLAAKVPPYPNNVYDYHYVDRVLPVGVSVRDLRSWNYDLGLILRKLGIRKQANVVIIPTNLPPAFMDEVNRSWLGGKKNDIIIGIGTDGKNIMWVRVLSWSKAETFKVELRDALLASQFDRQQIMGVIETQIMKGFVRRPWSDFDYLKNEIEPSTTACVVIGILAFFASLGLAFYFHKNDPFGDSIRNGFSNYNPYRRYR